MGPEKFLEQLQRKSLAFRVLAPGLFSTGLAQIIKEIAGAMGEQWDLSLGVDSRLSGIGRSLVEHFPPEKRDTLSAVPIGYIYDLGHPNGYTTEVPDDGAVVCITSALTDMLRMGNSCLFSLDKSQRESLPGALNVLRGYAALKCLHYLQARTASCLPPFPPPGWLNNNQQAEAALSNQLPFAVAHELAHVALGHVWQSPQATGLQYAAEELEADRLAARVLFDFLKRSTGFKDRIALEVTLGAFASVVYVGDLILELTQSEESTSDQYPPAEERFAVIIDHFREQLNDPSLVASGLLFDPYGLALHLAATMKADPASAALFFSEISRDCGLLGDTMEALYALLLTRDMARSAHLDDLASKASWAMDELKTQIGEDWNWRPWEN
jgi:hypothetical protein